MLGTVRSRTFSSWARFEVFVGIRKNAVILDVSPCRNVGKFQQYCSTTSHPRLVFFPQCVSERYVGSLYVRYAVKCAVAGRFWFDVTTSRRIHCGVQLCWNPLYVLWLEQNFMFTHNLIFFIFMLFLTLSDPTSNLVRQYDFRVPLRCRKTSDTVFVAFVCPLSEPVRRFSSCSTDFSQQVAQVVLFLFLSFKTVE
jgi:hypothetical protein